MRGKDRILFIVYGMVAVSLIGFLIALWTFIDGLLTYREEKRFEKEEDRL